jgi:hypothetical protein
MAHRAPAKVDSPYATVEDVARIYGVSSRRVARVVALVDRFLQERTVTKPDARKTARRRIARRRK